MTEHENASPAPAIPPDDPARKLTVANPSDKNARRVSVAGDAYTILVSGEDSGGRCCLIDMHVPPGGGPPPHRHDFEETFTLLEGELEFTFRGKTSIVPAGTTVNIPANAPHAFKNISTRPARMLCFCAPAGLDAFFLEIGDPIAGRDAPPPDLSAEEIAARREKAASLMAKYKTEILA